MVYLQRSFVLHRPQTYEYQTVSADGQLYYLEESVVAIDAKPNGAATAADEALILVRDITQHKQLEASLLVSQIELQEKYGVDRSLKTINSEFRYATFLKRIGGATLAVIRRLLDWWGGQSKKSAANPISIFSHLKLLKR